MMTLRALPNEVYEVQEFLHKRDLSALAAENATLRKQLLNAGLEPAGRSSEEWFEMFCQAAAVMRTAQLALEKLGTAREMLADWT